MTAALLQSPRMCPQPEQEKTPAVEGGPTARVRLGIKRNQLARPEIRPERALSVTRSYRDTEGEPLFTRRGRMLLRIAAEHAAVIQEGELIVGMKALIPRGSPVFPEISCDWIERDIDRLATRANTPFYVSAETKRVLRAEVFPYWKGRQVGDRIMEAVPAEIWKADERGVIYNYFRSRTIGHINAGYEKVLAKGMHGVIADVERSLSRLDDCKTDADSKRRFLGSVTMACEAAILLAGRHASEARRMAAIEVDPARRAELEGIARVLDRVPAEPAATFHEALQSFWITHLMLNLETDGHAFGPGRFDQVLYPYYRRSIDTGEITQEQAQELLDLMWVKFDEITLAKDSGESQTSSSYPEFQNLNIGGLTRQGQDAVNALSYMCLEALEHTRLPQPGLSAQIASLTPPRFLMRCCEVLRLGTGMPAMFNADSMVLGMVNRGKTLSDARASSLNGCVATFCDGRDRMASTGYFNLAKALELALNNGVDRLTGEPLGPATGDPKAFAGFEEVMSALEAQVEHFVTLKIRYDDTVRAIYARHCPVPFTSAVIDDCIATATDWHAGGSHYKIATMSGVAVGTVADALSGIRKQIFTDGRLGMAELIDALDRNWEGREELRRTLAHKTPHYGNDDDFPDALAVRVQEIFCSAVERHTDIQGAKYWVDLLPTTSHIALGALTGATPDGRRAGEWLSEGVSPVQGHDRCGPTAAARSVAKLDHARTNGTLLNIKINPQTVATDRDLRKLAALIRTYFAQGGFHMQFNIVDRGLLVDAMERPDEHRNLLIRVAGYSDYFVLLSRDIQEEILSRAEHGV
ncbi:MAG: formate C-acetyltransferase/glycerol dehydratase family glycyl radical enzyme [Desulfobacterales bacterium]